MGKGLSASRDELMMWAIRKGLDFSEDRDKIEKERLRRKKISDTMSTRNYYSSSSSEPPTVSTDDLDKTFSEVDNRKFSKIGLQEAISLGNAQGNIKKHGGYIGTSQSFKINSVIRDFMWKNPNATDEDLLKHLEGFKNEETFSDSSSRNFRDIVEKLDKNMRPIGKDIELVRMVDWKGRGASFHGFKQTLDTLGFDGTERSIKGAIMEFVTPTSTSWDLSRNFFKGRDTMLHIKAPKETLAMIDSARTAEAEIILSRNTMAKITGFKNDGGKKHLYLTLIPKKKG